MGSASIRPDLVVPNKPLITVKTNADLNREDEEAALRHADERAALPEVAGLSAFVQQAYLDAEQNRERANVDTRIESARRVINSEYEPGDLAEIEKQGGSTTFFNITDTKVSTADAWLNEVLQPVQGKPWSIRPTPVPSLPPELMEQAIEETFAAFSEELGSDGEGIDVASFQAFAMEQFDSLLQTVLDSARRRTRNMEKFIEDQLAEGDFSDVLTQFIQALAEELFACIKGPILRSQKRLRWNERTGSVEVKDVLVPFFYNVESINLFPSPTARTLQDGYLCEVGYIDPTSLGAMKGVDGWDGEAIEAVLHEFSEANGASRDEFGVDHTRATMQELQDHDPHKDDFHAAAIRFIEYWGPIQRKFVLEAGFPKDTYSDDGKSLNDYDEMQIVKIGRHIVKASRNPDPKGRRPYHGTSYQNKSGTIWGKSISEKMGDVQRSVGAALRHLQNNMALASGPQVALDISTLDPGDTERQVFPGKIWQYNGNGSRPGSKPVDFFQPNPMVGPVLEFAEYMQQQADDRTLIPRFAHGNENVGGAGETASGLNMLMTAAAKGIRKVIKSVDKDVIRPVIHMLYDWNLLYADEPSIKADCEVIPMGIVAELVREQNQTRIGEFLQATLNDTDMQIIGMEGRRELLEKAAERFGVDASKVIPDEDELRKRVADNLAMQEQQIAEERAAEVELANQKGSPK